jgi:hypothetical protein
VVRPGEARRGARPPVYGWFTQGFDTRDLPDAKALLDTSWVDDDSTVEQWLDLQHGVLHIAAGLQQKEPLMKTVTVRQISPTLARVIAGRARRMRSSVGKAALGLLEEAAGLATHKTQLVRHHDLDALAGAWTREEAKQFNRALRAQRRVDPDLWR